MSECKKAEEYLFFDSEDYFARLIKDISEAAHSVKIESYIFALDVCGKRLLRAMLGAVRRGIVVQLMVDGVGSLEYITKLNRITKRFKIHFRIFHPLPWQLPQANWYNFIPMFLVKLIRSLAELNCRNHRKCCIIDQKILYAGSFNVMASSFDQTASLATTSLVTKTLTKLNHSLNHVAANAWCDVGIRITHVSLSSALLAFKMAWEQQKISQTWRETLTYLKSDPRIRLNSSWYQRLGLRMAMLRRLRLAKKRVWITNAYFVPDSRFMRSLLKVAALGVDVKILLPQHSDVRFMPLASRTFYQRMLTCGIQVFEYMPAILHAKTLIIDDWMVVGSSNLNHRSLLHDLELDVVIKTPSEKARLVADFQAKLTVAHQIEAADLVSMPWWQKLSGNLLLWLRYWL